MIDAKGVSPVDCDEARLGQVLLNLIVNAAQAIPEGAADRNEIRVSARDDGEDQVLIEVRDTGAGIAPEDLGRIFDPFFTTKPVGVGTGLGLAIVQRIVTDNGGHLTVESQLGSGTTIRISLPAAERLLAPPAPSPAPNPLPPVPPVPGAAPTLAEPALVAPDPCPVVASAPVPIPVSAPALSPPKRPRVLVIDDEIHVLRSIQRGLGRSHDLVVLTSAEEALDRIRAGECFDAIVCDLMMPEMTGMDLHAALTASGSPAVRSMVFITGGAFTQRARDFLASVDNPYLEKPFEFEALRGTIATRRASLASPSAGA